LFRAGTADAGTADTADTADSWTADGGADEDDAAADADIRSDVDTGSGGDLRGA
jgi:hypothetical protein